MCARRQSRYYHDDPDTLWWVFFAIAQGGFLQSGGCFIRGGSRRLSSAIARAVKAAGGEIVLSRQVGEIRLARDSDPTTVVHTGRDGKDRVEVEARVVASNSAPALLAEMLPDPVRAALRSAYDAEPLSTSLFALTLELSAPPARFGLRDYSTFLLPLWVKRLADFPRSADLFAAMPCANMPSLIRASIAASEGHLIRCRSSASTASRTGLASTGPPTKTSASAGGMPLWRTSTVSFPASRHMSPSLPSAPRAPCRAILPRPPARSTASRYARRAARSGAGWNRRRARCRIFTSSYAGSGGFSGAIMGGASAADCILADT